MNVDFGFHPVEECVRVSSNRRVAGGTSLTGLPVLLAEYAAPGLHNIQSQVENHAILAL